MKLYLITIILSLTTYISVLPIKVKILKDFLPRNPAEEVWRLKKAIFETTEVIFYDEKKQEKLKLTYANDFSKGINTLYEVRIKPDEHFLYLYLHYLDEDGEVTSQKLLLGDIKDNDLSLLAIGLGKRLTNVEYQGFLLKGQRELSLGKVEGGVTTWYKLLDEVTITPTYLTFKTHLFINNAERTEKTRHTVSKPFRGEQYNKYKFLNNKLSFIEINPQVKKTRNVHLIYDLGNVQYIFLLDYSIHRRYPEIDYFMTEFEREFQKQEIKVNDK
jgi:hypothetical protein